MKKKRPVDIIIGAFTVYFFIGISTVAIQASSGAKCGPVHLDGYYIYSVNENVSHFWLMRAMQWLPNMWGNVVGGEVSFGDFMSPKECVWVKKG